MLDNGGGTEGLPAVGVSPLASGWSTSGKKVVEDGCDTLERLLRTGLVPVIHGDCVLDVTQGCAIIRQANRAQANVLFGVNMIPLHASHGSIALMRISIMMYVAPILQWGHHHEKNS